MHDLTHDKTTCISVTGETFVEPNTNLLVMLRLQLVAARN